MKLKYLFILSLLLSLVACSTTETSRKIPRVEDIIQLIEKEEGARVVQTKDSRSPTWTIWIWAKPSVISISNKYEYKKLRAVANYFPNNKNEKNRAESKKLIQLYIDAISDAYPVFSDEYIFEESELLKTSDGKIAIPDGKDHTAERDLPSYDVNPHYKKK